MEQQAILCPVLALVALTALVWLTMIVKRFGVLGAMKVPPEQVASREQVNAVIGSKDHAGNNFLNLFELPLLFYVLAAFAMITQTVSPFLVTLAWVYVGLRALHSLIHLTYNKVMHRFSAWAASTLVLWAMWICFAMSLPGAPS